MQATPGFRRRSPIALAGQVSMVSSTILIAPLGTNGALIAAQLIVRNIIGGAASGFYDLNIIDGFNRPLANTGFGVAAAQIIPALIVLDISNISIPYENGLTLTISLQGGTGVFGGVLSMNIYTER